MTPQVQVAVIAALTAGCFTAAGWFVTYLLTKRREDEVRRQEASVRHLQRQIEELYGPLLGLIQQRHVVHDVAVLRLPHHEDGRLDRSEFSPSDAKIYDYLAEKYFLPVDAQIAALLRTKVYLLASDELPDSFRHFLRHQAQFECLHLLYIEHGIKSGSFKGVGWPADLEADVEAVLRDLRRRYRTYVEALGATDRRTSEIRI